VVADGKFHIFPVFTGVNYLEYLKSTLGMHCSKGQSGASEIMTIPMHWRIIRKPGRSEMLREFMLYIKGKEGFGLPRGRHKELPVLEQSYRP